jgi:hypothetical protein
MAGGDTLIVKNGSYSIGTEMLAPPSGTASAPTRILGEQHGACRVKPELWGTGGVPQVFLATARSHVQFKCLEITDHSDCLSGHHDAAIACGSSHAFGRSGFFMHGASDILIEDVNVHGMGHSGFRGSKVHNLTLRRSRLVGNGRAGFDGNVYNGDDDSFTGTLLFQNVEVAWNGCGEDYPTLKIYACFGQGRGGYGDGLGTSDTSGTWVIEDSYFHHNASDGLDLRYTKLAGADVIVRRSWFYANAGNQVKVWGKLLMENSYASSHCTYFGSRYGTDSQGNPDPKPCRADGNTVMIVAPNISGIGITLRYNTIVGESAQLVQFNQDAGAGSSSIARLENNVFVGDTLFTGSGLPKLVGNVPGISVEYYSNHIYNVSGGTCPSGSTCTDPLLRNQNISTFDPRPQSSSPVLGAGNTNYTTPTTDITGRARPSAPARGAFEF